MISRRTTLILAEIYTRAFYSKYQSSIGSGYGRKNKTYYRVNIDKLYDFLYTHNYEPWFCNQAKTTRNYSEKLSDATRNLKEFILRLHTGETQVNATPEWTWEQRQQLGQRYLHNLAEDILNVWNQEWSNLPSYSKPNIDEHINNLQRNLELDGYTYQLPRLLTPESDVLEVKEEAGLLKSLFKRLALANEDTTFYFLALSEEHFVAGRWGDSISNSRKFFESILQEVASAHSRRVKGTMLPESTYTRPVEVRKYLELEGLLEKKETETIAKVYGLLSYTGGHPYMAQNDQARLLRHLALTFTQFVMLRFQGSIAT